MTGPARPERRSVQLPPGGGLLLVDKPAGCTSHDVVGRVRRVLGLRRVGHAGTLDPMATGLLVIAVDRATKLLGHLALTDKTYLATIRLGISTDSDDADGDVVATADPARVAAVDDRQLEDGIAALTGELMQVPSAVSAIKVDGRRAYDRVRAGEQVALAARPVTVSRFARTGPARRGPAGIDVDVVVDASTGTYVRSLARDLGAALGVGGHLTALRRTRVGPFTVADAVDVYAGPPAERPAVTDALVAAVSGALLPAADAVRRAFPVHTVDDRQAVDLGHGRRIPAAGLPGTYAAFDRSGALIALACDDGAQARSVFGWHSPA
ncbi:tRNA pseudouridine(55) synthase TruB [Nakamurella multipartita]|uniref:tRNA pseudouridine synthase B n=1 Tax=Nakamurella multipartita (strain ATCC 700099 / DSM 44233 / CIP 104796 / JCM 9543 / NBRC 105858 / Y-104) TaxID=479431 RepID=C8XJC5_NAKMY|nr:tRNA pseudouridine(55) synthase TruB [Nakamurella multipartita]ACV78590.1 tRNA pseudouridine synthase B [Nakamurella multipartita DSM 44233]HOZ56721.1 tRNA pseudouridine(55) synthase TruB [Nakamurella multipartita]